MSLSEIQEICLATLLICILLSCFLKRGKFSWCPTFITDSTLWLVLNIYRFHKNTVEIMERKTGTHSYRGKLVGFSDILMTVDPANIHYITTSNFQKYPKGYEYRKIFDVMGYGLFNSDNEDYKQQRRLVHTPIKSREFFHYYLKTAHFELEQVLLPVLMHACNNKNYVLDMQDVFQRFALDVGFKAVAGHDPQSLTIDLPSMPFLGAMADFEGGIIYRFILWEVLWKLQLLIGIGPENKLSHARKVIGSYISDIVSKKQRDVITRHEKVKEDDDEEGADLLTSLMKELLKDVTLKNHITNNNDVKYFEDMTLQLLVATRDTTSSAMTWLIWLIATHPKVEQKIRDEITATIPGAKEEKLRVFNYSETYKLVYLHAAINESLRLYPPAPFQAKTPGQSDVLPSGHAVHLNTKIVISLYVMARMKSIWGNNCSDFVPERWISKQGTMKHEVSSKFFVFYAGPRSCIGKELAMTQIKMVAATLLHNFKFEVVQGQDIIPDISIILHMKHGLKVKLHKRWKCSS